MIIRGLSNRQDKQFELRPDDNLGKQQYHHPPRAAHPCTISDQSLAFPRSIIGRDAYVRRSRGGSVGLGSCLRMCSMCVSQHGRTIISFPYQWRDVLLVLQTRGSEARALCFVGSR